MSNRRLRLRRPSNRMHTAGDLLRAATPASAPRAHGSVSVHGRPHSAAVVPRAHGCVAGAATGDSATGGVGAEEDCGTAAAPTPAAHAFCACASEDGSPRRCNAAAMMLRCRRSSCSRIFFLCRWPVMNSLKVAGSHFEEKIFPNSRYENTPARLKRRVYPK